MSEDLNICTTPGLYRVSLSGDVDSHHAPMAQGLLIVNKSVVNSTVTFLWQKMSSTSNLSQNKVLSYSRFGRLDSGVATWYSWTRTDNFGCNTLDELKEALANV